MNKPVVGVIPLWDEKKESLWMLPDYLDGLRAAGAVPFIFPLETDQEDLLALYALCDGLLLTGGQDVNPELYGQVPSALCGAPCPTRDSMEQFLFSRAFSDDKPVLGICRGIQLINVLLGGTLWQDLPTEHPSPVTHAMTAPYDRVCHTVALTEGSPLRALLKTDALGVNSYHHQGIRTLAPGLAAMANSPDGVTEAICDPEKRFCWAVQWHPEFSFRSDPNSAAIFRRFVESMK